MYDMVEEMESKSMIANPNMVLLNAAEAAKVLAISPRTLWSLTDTGELPCVRIGRAVRYDPADLRALIDRRKITKGT
jgi:excisionase family DNA binding protein